MTELDNLHVVLTQEFSVSCDMIKLAIENMDERTWSDTKDEWSYVQTLYHIISTIEFYSYDEPRNLTEKGILAFFTPNSSPEEVERIISTKTKTFFNDYLEKVKEQMTFKLRSFTTEELFAKDKFNEWGFTSRFHKFSYTLRHTMFHTGELNKNLRELNKTRLKWL